MKYKLTLWIYFTVLTGFAQTQGEMNKNEIETYQKIEYELNALYKSILVEYESDTLLTENLKESQRVWAQYRDIQLKVKYPDYGDGYYGTVHSMCVADYLNKLTKERILILKEWIDGVQEGDVCSGSVKIKE